MSNFELPLVYKHCEGNSFIMWKRHILATNVKGRQYVYFSKQIKWNDILRAGTLPFVSPPIRVDEVKWEPAMDDEGRIVFWSSERFLISEYNMTISFRVYT